MAKTAYEITHEGAAVRTHVTEGLDSSTLLRIVRNMTDLMLKLSDEKAGRFTLWDVEIDPETGRRNYTRIASAKNGVKIWTIETL